MVSTTTGGTADHAAARKNTMQAGRDNSVRSPRTARKPRTGTPPRVRDRASKSSSGVNAVAASGDDHHHGNHALSLEDGRKIRASVRHAAAIGLPFNRFVTIAWELAGVEDIHAAQRTFCKFLYDWLKRQEAGVAYLWVLERGSTLGVHSHMLIHVPPALARRMSQLQPGWLKQAGAKRRSGYVKTLSISRSYRSALSRDGLTLHRYAHDLKRVVDYLLKGSDTATRNRLGVRHHAKYGAISGQRVGRSRLLGPKAIVAHRAVREQQQVSGLEHSKCDAIDTGKAAVSVQTNLLEAIPSYTDRGRAGKTRPHNLSNNRHPRCA
jgi:hypothetical protein